MTDRHGSRGRFLRIGAVVFVGILVLSLTPLADGPKGVVDDALEQVGIGRPGNEACASQRILLPIYPSNTTAWDEAINSGMPAGSILIMSLGGTPASDDPYKIRGGPGVALDLEMLERVREAQDRGYYVIGYVRTGETGSNSGPRRDRTQTDIEIRALKDWYNVDGIFYDEVYADEAYYQYYVDLVAYGREIAPGLQVMNAGGTTSAEYASLGDVVGTFEGTADSFHNWSLADWQREFPPSQWAAAVMSVANADEMDAIVKRSRDNHLGYIYTTDMYGGSMENPWTRLPPYWSDLLSELKSC